jgi:hypothetical protein
MMTKHPPQPAAAAPTLFLLRAAAEAFRARGLTLWGRGVVHHGALLGQARALFAPIIVFLCG